MPGRVRHKHTALTKLPDLPLLWCSAGTIYRRRQRGNQAAAVWWETSRIYSTTADHWSACRSPNPQANGNPQNQKGNGKKGTGEKGHRRQRGNRPKPLPYSKFKLICLYDLTGILPTPPPLSISSGCHYLGHFWPSVFVFARAVRVRVRHFWLLRTSYLRGNGLF